MSRTASKVLGRIKRKARVRSTLTGTAARPRLSVFRSNKHIYAQIVDDESARTLVSVSTLTESVKADIQGKKKAEAAKVVGVALAKVAKEKDIVRVVFDRNGFKYHGRVMALAAGAREAGLDF